MTHGNLRTNILLTTLSLFLLLQILPVSSHTVDSWTTGNTCENVTLDGTNQTLNINAGQYLNVTSAKINITAPISLIINRWANLSANVTTYRGYWIINAAHSVNNPENTNDGYLDTYAYVNGAGTGSAHYYANFTLSGGVVQNVTLNIKYRTDGAVANYNLYCKNDSLPYTTNYVNSSTSITIDSGATIKTGGAIQTRNYTVPRDCWKNDQVIRIHFGSDSTNPTDYLRIYEIFQNYSVTGYPPNLTIFTGDQLAYQNTTQINGSANINLNSTYLTEYLLTTATIPIKFSSPYGIINACLQEFNFTNNIEVLLYDEETLLLLTGQNMTVEVTLNDTTTNYYTTTGEIYINGELDGDYTVSAYNSNYSKSSQVVTITETGFQNISLYLSNKSSSSIFTIQDRLTADIISDALITQERILNGVWTVVASKYSDITGKLTIYYVPDVRYKFTVEKEGFITKVFYLDPIIYSTYLINLDRTTSVLYYNDFEDISFSTDPKEFTTTTQNNLTATIQSVAGILTYYNVTVGYPGGSLSDSGTANNGETLTFNFNISSAGVWDKVNITLTYNTTANVTRTFSYTFGITGTFGTGYTWISNKDNPTGAGILERTLLAVLGAIIVAGFVTYSAGPLAGGIMAILSMVFSSIIGWVPVYSIIPGILIGLLLIATRSSE